MRKVRKSEWHQVSLSNCEEPLDSSIQEGKDLGKDNFKARSPLHCISPKKRGMGLR